MKNGMRITALAAAAAGIGFANAAAAYEPGDWLVRLGAMNVDPKTDNHEVVSVDDGTSMTLGFTYMMTDIWAVEVLAAVPFEHDLQLLLDDPELGNPVIGSTKHLPPTVTLQYRFRPTEKLQPYVGVGINYTKFSGEKTKGLLAGAKLDLEESWGATGQIGFDYLFTDNVFFNIDVRYANIETDVKIDGANLGDAVPGTSNTVKIDPMVYGAHLGFRF